MGRRPGGFPRAELAQHRAGGVIYHVHETAVGGAIFQPGMKAGIPLHQFAEMRLAHPALAIRLSRSLAAPKSGRSSSAAGSRRRLAVRLLPPTGRSVLAGARTRAQRRLGGALQKPPAATRAAKLSLSA